MRAVRLGSYSTLATTAGTPILLRLKSTMRKRRLWPPPRKRDVMRPLLLRPPDLLVFSVSARSGRLPCESSEKSGDTRPRTPGVVGLCCLRPMCLHSLEELDVLAGGERHDRLLPGRRAAGEATHALLLAANHAGADVDDIHVPQLLDGVANLDLVRVASHLEEELRFDRLGRQVIAGLPAGLLQPGALLREEGALDDQLWCSHDLVFRPQAAAASLVVGVA